MENTLQPNSPQWIEDIPVEEMQLTFEHFTITYKEFCLLSELTTNVIAVM